MQTIIYATTFAACNGNACPPPASVPPQMQPVPVVIYQAAPRPLLPIFAQRPQTVIISAPACVGGSCSRP